MFPLLAILFCVGFWTFLFVASRRTRAAKVERRSARVELLQRELGATPNPARPDDHEILRSGIRCDINVFEDETKIQLEFARADETTPVDVFEERFAEHEERPDSPGAEWNTEAGAGLALALDAEDPADPDLVSIFAPHVDRLARAGVTYVGCYSFMLECNFEATTDAELVANIRSVLDPLFQLSARMDRRYVEFAEAELAKLPASA